MCEKKTDIGILILRLIFLIIYLNNSPDTNPTDMAPIVTSGIGAIPVITQEIKSAVKAVIEPIRGPKRKEERKIGTHSKVMRIAPKFKKFFAKKASTVVAAANRPVKATIRAFPSIFNSLINPRESLFFFIKNASYEQTRSTWR